MKYGDLLPVDIGKTVTIHAKPFGTASGLHVVGTLDIVGILQDVHIFQPSRGNRQTLVFINDRAYEADNESEVEIE